jgi:hypothetical protein
MIGMGRTNASSGRAKKRAPLKRGVRRRRHGRRPYADQKLHNEEALWID